MQEFLLQIRFVDDCYSVCFATDYFGYIDGFDYSDFRFDYGFYFYYCCFVAVFFADFVGSADFADFAEMQQAHYFRQVFRQL